MNRGKCIKKTINGGTLTLLALFISLFMLENGCCSSSDDKHDLSVTDLALIYGGGAHRKMTWDEEHFVPYISYTDRKGKDHWLFDGFLMLEIIDGKGKIFATGYYGVPSTKDDWTALVDYYFTPGQCVDALNQCIAKKVKGLGKPSKKRKIIIGIPEPIVAGLNSHYEQTPADYWGDIDGKKLDFNDPDDRIIACKWYIDYVRNKFDEGKYNQLVLAGFYWIAETAGHTKTILPVVGEYIHQAGYTFNWIPYWKGGTDEPDYFSWKALGFHKAYLQPNYFFNDKIPYSRLEEACKVAKDYDLDLELEFDMRVFTNQGDRSSRLYDYLNAFRQNGVLTDKRIAYYQDADALYHLYHASNAKEREIYHDFCTFVVEHQSAHP